MALHVPWTLEKWHIRVAFRKIGVHVPEEAITMPTKTISGPNLDLQEKQFYVTVTINNVEEVKVKCRIHHWTDKPEEKLRMDENIWDLPINPIFPEDRAILESLPKHRLAQP
ncbi:hypothetical protein KM043_009831 [Ampulex compressa]|nr:hypothetical protein KM043_009831 [Ampulex compressa]